MVLALETSKSCSRTRRTSSRISAFVSLISLSAFAVAALDAFLRRLSACSGAWVQQSPCDPLVGSMQRSPFALVAQHWFHLHLPFLWGGWGTGLALPKKPAPVGLGSPPHHYE